MHSLLSSHFLCCFQPIVRCIPGLRRHFLYLSESIILIRCFAANPQYSIEDLGIFVISCSKYLQSAIPKHDRLGLRSLPICFHSSWYHSSIPLLPSWSVFVSCFLQCHDCLQRQLCPKLSSWNDIDYNWRFVLLQELFKQARKGD